MGGLGSALFGNIFCEGPWLPGVVQGVGRSPMGTFVQLAFGPYGHAAVGIIFYEARTVNAGAAESQRWRRRARVITVISNPS